MEKKKKVQRETPEAITRGKSSGDSCLHAQLRRELPSNEKAEGPFKDL